MSGNGSRIVGIERGEYVLKCGSFYNTLREMCESQLAQFAISSPSRYRLPFCLIPNDRRTDLQAEARHNRENKA
jgi:hypothetical protein